MPLLELEKTGLLSLVDAKIEEECVTKEKCLQCTSVENQLPEYYNRVRGEYLEARGRVEGMTELKELLEKLC